MDHLSQRSGMPRASAQPSRGEPVGHSRRGWLAGVMFLAALVAAMAATVGAPGPTEASASPGSETTATAATVGDDPCPGALQVVDEATERGRPAMCTHGADPGVTPEDLAAQHAVGPEATAGIQCYGDGTSGARVQLIYAHPDNVNRFAAFRRAIKRRAAQIDAIYDASAQQTGGHRHVRWATSPSCNINVQSVLIPAAAIPTSGIETLIDSLERQGFSSNDRKYLVWVDTNTSRTAPVATCLGLGTIYRDDTDTAANLNNRFGGYTRVDEKCLLAIFDPVAAHVEAHELMHTLGAVQSDAPNATREGHCTDEYDIMCYADAPGTATRRVCSGRASEMRLDCNHDDYFSTNPTRGGYLDTHWNSADSRWLESVPGYRTSTPR